MSLVITTITVSLTQVMTSLKIITRMVLFPLLSNLKIAVMVYGILRNPFLTLIALAHTALMSPTKIEIVTKLGMMKNLTRMKMAMDFILKVKVLLM